MFPVEIFRSTLTKFVEVLNRFGIRFQLTGGSRIPTRADDREKALESKGMFQVLHIEQALKLALYPEFAIPGELDRSVMAGVLPGVTLESALVRGNATRMGLVDALDRILSGPEALA